MSENCRDIHLPDADEQIRVQRSMNITHFVKLYDWFFVIINKFLFISLLLHLSWCLIGTSTVVYYIFTRGHLSPIADFHQKMDYLRFCCHKH